MGHQNADVAKLADAPDLGSGSKEWGFKSSHPHQNLAKANSPNLLENLFIWPFLLNIGA